MTKKITRKDYLDNEVKEYIINAIDGEGYDLPNDALITTEGKLRFLYNTFIKEYGFSIERYGEQRAFREWLQGLPSCINIAFTNYDILELAYKWGNIPNTATENKKYALISNYFNFITVKTFQLFKKFKIK